MPLQDAIYRFGPYELRTQARELYKHGARLKLRPQSFQILNALVARPGNVVSREELRHLLWNGQTFVDFEHGMNTAIKELRGLLNDSASEPRYIETLPKLGYRFIVPVKAGFPLPPDQPAAQPEAVMAGSESGSKKSVGLIRAVLAQRRRSIAILATVGLIVGLAAYVQWSRSRARSQASNRRAMLAVLPFENLTGDNSQDYFSDGLTEEVIGQLGRLDPQHVGVIARTSVMPYKRTQEPLQQIGRELGVEYILEGSVRRDSDKVRISVQLIQLKDQTHLWSRQYDRERGDLLAVQDEIARAAADEIQATLGSPKPLAIAVDNRSVSVPNSEAYDLYLRGRYFWNKRTPDGFRQAADYFQQAIAKDPRYAPPYAGLADTYGLMSTWNIVPQNEFMPKARAAGLKALEIDESLAEAHTSLALVAENYDYDWQTAEKEFRRAIQLDPSYPTAHHWYAEYLSWQGRFEEALAESEQARQLDPMSLIIATDHGAILYFSRQYDRAIAQFRLVLDMDPHFGRAVLIINAYVEEGKFAEAMNEVERLLPPDSSPWTCATKTYVYGRWGRTSDAQRYFAKYQQSIQHVPLDPTVFTLIAYLGMKQKDQAIALLEKSYSEHSNAVVTLKVDPAYDFLRGDPRFQDLLRRVHLAK